MGLKANLVRPGKAISGSTTSRGSVRAIALVQHRIGLEPRWYIGGYAYVLEWGHGAFTRALLDALRDPLADPSHIGLISSNALAVYMHQHVPDLTDHLQTPGLEVRFESTVFAPAH